MWQLKCDKLTCFLMTTSKGIRLWGAQYLLSGIAGLVIGWPIIEKVDGAWAVLSLLLLTTWIVSFLHLSGARPGRRAVWFFIASVLSFVAPLGVSLISGTTVEKALISGLIVCVLGTISAGVIAKRAKAKDAPSSGSQRFDGDKGDGQK